jgi:hypothetical protein
MNRREDSARSDWWIFRNGLPTQDTAFKKKPRNDASNPQGAQNDEQRDRSAMRMPAATDFLHTATNNLMATLESLQPLSRCDTFDQ